MSGGTGSVAVTLPANTETLVILVPQAGYDATIEVLGMTTGHEYPSTVLPVSAIEVAFFTGMANVAPPADASVTVTLGSAPTVTWYIVADAGVRLVTELTVQSAMQASGASVPPDGIAVLGSDGTDARFLRTSQQGILYGVWSAPDTATGDHPPNELQIAQVVPSGTGITTLVAAPGTGKRLRVFYLKANIFSTSGGDAQLADTSGVTYCYAQRTAGTGDLSIDDLNLCGTSGLALTANAGLTGQVNVASTAFFSAVYTVETV